MFSKIFLLILAALILTNCQDYLRGNAKKNDIIQVESIETKCLQGVPDFLSEVLDDKSNDEFIEKNFSCIKTALKTFARFTRGSTKNLYTDKELQYFLNRYLLKKNQISDEFLAQLMKIKSYSVGGELNNLTRTEIDLLLNFLDTIKNEIKNLKGLFKVITFRADVVEEGALEVAKSKLLSAAINMLKENKSSAYSYEFSDLGDFASQLNIFLKSDLQPDVNLNLFLKYFPVVSAFKNLFLGEHAQTQGRSEWAENIDWSNKAYFLSLQYFYQIQKFRYSDPTVWKNAMLFADNLFDLIEKSPVMKNRGFLSTSNIDVLIDSFWDSNIVKSKFSSDLIKSTYRKIISYFIDPKKEFRDENVKIRGFDQNQFATLRLEFNVWKQTQKYLIKAFEKKSEYSLAEFRSYLLQNNQPKDNYQVIGKLGSLLTSWDEWMAIFSKQKLRPVALTADYKVMLYQKPEQMKYSLLTTSLLNGFRSTVRFLLRGYGEGNGQNIFKSEIREEGLALLETDFRDFGEVAGILDPNHKNSSQKTFKEGNFFTFSGNGDQRLDGAEIFELLNFMFTGGNQVVNQMRSELETLPDCLSNDPIAALGAVKQVKLVCFKKALLEKADLFFNNAPELIKYLKSLTPYQYDEVYNTLLKVSRDSDTQKSEFISESEMRTFFTILEYVESLIIQFDDDLSGTLSQTELLNAEPRFRQYIKEIGKTNFDFLAKEAFVYLIYNGQKPTNKDLLLSFFQRHKEDVSRLHLYRVLDVIKNDANQ